MILGLKFHRITLKYKMKVHRNSEIITLLIKKNSFIVIEGIIATYNLH